MSMDHHTKLSIRHPLSIATTLSKHGVFGQMEYSIIYKKLRCDQDFLANKDVALLTDYY
jgi:hypothetical protein